MKKCPYCAEEIHDTAETCKWCGESVVPNPYTPPAAAPGPAGAPPVAAGQPVPQGPGPARAAGILWIIFGGVQLLGGAVVWMALQAAGLMDTDAAGGLMVGLGLQLLFGLAFLIEGIKTVTLTRNESRRNGIGSIVIGVITLFGACTPGPPIKAVVAMAGAGLLLIAGILALTGNQTYQAYRWSVGKRD